MTPNQSGPTCPQCHHQHAADPWPATCDECGRALPAPRRPLPASRRGKGPSVGLILIIAAGVLGVAVAAVLASMFRATILALPGPPPPSNAATPAEPTKPSAPAGSAFDRLKSVEAGDRAEAARELARRPADDARRDAVRTAIRPLLKDDSEVVRRSAILALATWADASDVPALVDLLKADWVAESRPAIIRALARLADGRSAAALAGLLSGTGDADLAADALATIGPDAESATLPFLFHPDEKARARAARILKALGTKPPAITAAALRELDGHPERAKEALGWLASAVPASAERRMVLIRTTELMEPGRDEGLRTAAANAVGTWADSVQVDLLWKMLRDESPGVRHAALAALGRLKDKRTLPALAAHLRVAEDRAVTTKALGAFGSQAESDVQLQLNAADAGTRAAACRVLQAVGTSRSGTVLRALLNDPDREVAVAARSALQVVLDRR